MCGHVVYGSAAHGDVNEVYPVRIAAIIVVLVALRLLSLS